MNGTGGIIFGIGMALAVLAVFAASAAAQNNTVYFDPDPSCAAPGETIVVTMYVNNSDPIQNWQADIYFDPTVVNITGYTCGEFPLGCQMAHHGNWVRRGGITGDGANLPPGIHELGTLTLEAIGPGTSTLDLRNHVMGNMYGQPLPNQVWIDGTFNCPCATLETFTKDLVEGWNLISLPLINETDMTVANIIDSSLSGSYDALYKYDASAHNFVPLNSTDTMEIGVGYFIHMTSADTWTYTGIPYEQMNVSLEPGLNMIGWLNCSENISDALSSIAGDYWYIARWNATAQKFEVYNPVAPPAFNDFTMMERGEGYFISMKSARTLTRSC